MAKAQRLGARATTGLGSEARYGEGLLVKTQDDDEAFEQEMAAAPWGYGQNPTPKVDVALAAVRLRGMWTEASVIALELAGLKAEIQRLKEKCGEV